VGKLDLQQPIYEGDELMEGIQLLGISGSPRRHGNSRFLLEVALESAEAAAPDAVRSELYSISGKEFKPCDSCNQCHEQLGHCRHTDDDFPELRDKWFAADAIIYSVPVYHMGIPGQLKIFLDRLGNSVVDSFHSRPLKVIGVLAQGTGMATGQESVLTFLNNHAVMMGCIPVGGLWPGGYLGVGGWTRTQVGKNALQDLHAQGEADIHFTVDAIKQLSKYIIQLALILKAGGEAVRPMLEADGGYQYFLRQLDIDRAPHD
jgi:multimeric flavodoxin WrbA